MSSAGAAEVVVNLCWIVPGGVGGSEQYATRLVGAALERLAGGTPPGAGPALSVRVAASAGFVAAHPGLAAVTFEAPLPAGSRPLRLAVESSWLARRSRGADLVHHMGGHVPAVRGAPAAVTVHDLQPLDLPANFSAVKARYLAWALPRGVRRAVRVAAPSRWVADRVAERLGVPSHRVDVVASTVDPVLTGHGAVHRAPPPGVEPDAEVVVYPAVTHPHKNHRVLIDAVTALARRRPRLRLVLTGGEGRAHAAVMARVAASGGRVVHRGRVSPRELGCWYARADVVAFPSRYEGFGLPVLEAMAAGVPVVVADATALPEVVGSAGLLVDPDDRDAWVDALDATLEGGSGVDERVAAGRRRAADFSPERSGADLVAFWRRCLDAVGGGGGRRRL